MNKLKQKKPKLKEFSNESLRRIAKQMIVLKYIIILHTWVYFIGNLTTFSINYLTNELSYPWFLWVLIGWTILLVMHFFTYWIFKKGIVDLSKLFLYYHIIIFILLQITVFFVDCFTSSTRWKPSGWFYWFLIIWSLLLLGHMIIVFYITPKRGEPIGKSWLDRKIEIEIKKMKNDKKLRNLNKKNQDYHKGKK